MQPRPIEPDAIHKHPKRRTRPNQHRLPPPVIILGAKLNVRKDYRNLNHGNKAHKADDAQESKDIVVAALVLPETLEDKEEFDEDDCKWDETR